MIIEYQRQWINNGVNNSRSLSKRSTRSISNPGTEQRYLIENLRDNTTASANSESEHL